MKKTKKLLSLLLVFVLSVSLTNSYETKAATETITVTLRVEQDFTSLLTPVQVTLTGEDKEKTYGIDCLAGINSPLKAYAKYLSTVKKVKDEDMNRYIVISGTWLSGINLTGDSSTTAGVDANVYWMYSVNDKAFMDTNGDGMGDAMTEYALKDKDSIVIYGAYMDPVTYASASYTHFDKTTYSVETGNPLSVTLTEENLNDTYTANVSSPCKNASVLIGTSSSAVTTTDENGKATLTFTKAGTYVLSAYKKTDGIHNDISRPYAVVTVKEKAATTNINKNDMKITPVTTTVTKPAKVTKVKVRVKKSKAKKKKITITWKKVAKASGYQVYVSKKKKSGFKKSATVKKAKATIKKKKGTYYIKVRAYKTANKAKIYGSYSKTVKVKVK